MHKTEVKSECCPLSKFHPNRNFGNDLYVALAVIGAMPTHFNFRTKQGPTVSVSNIRDIAFYGCSEIMRTRNFTIFTVYAKISGQLR